MSMGGVNKVTLIGNLGADPEIRYTNNGQAVAEVRMATNESWTGKDGKKQERTEWHRVVVWGKGAEIVKDIMCKGSKAYFDGRLQTRAWDDKDGNKRYTTEIVANDFMLLSNGRSKDERSNSPVPENFGKPSRMNDSEGVPDDDMPF